MSDPVDCRTRLQERVEDGLLGLDRERRVTSADPEAERLLGADAEHLRGRGLSESVPAIDGAFESRCLRAFERDEPVEFECPSPAGDGRLRFRIPPGETGATVQLESLPVAGEPDAGRPPVTDELTDAAVTVDTDGTIRQANSAMESLFGYEPSALVGEPLTRLMPDWLEERHERAFERYLESGERRVEWRDVELPGQRRDGEEIELSISFTEHGSGDDRRFTGTFRDVSQRKERRWALQQAYETFSDPDLGFNERVRELLELGCSVLDVEYGTVSQVEGDNYQFEYVVAPPGADLSAGDTVSLSATNCERVLATRETLALQDVSNDAPELADRPGNAEWGISTYLGVPVVVGEEPSGTFCFYDMEPRDEPFSDWEVTFVEHLGQWVAKELEQRRYVEQLHALNEVNQVVYEVADAVIEESTREEIEQRVCESLAATDSYLFAWIGQPDPETEAVELRAEAGVEGYLDDVTITIDADAEKGQGPTGRALKTGEVQTLQRVDVAPEYEPWRDVADAYGFRSSAAIPVVHEGTTYGVLNLYTERSDAFEGQEREMVQLLGRIVGHAIAAADRKQALLSDSMIELELRTTDVFSELGLSEPPTEPVEIEAAVPRGDGEYVVFGRAAPEDRAFIDELVANQSNWTDLVRVEEGDDRLRFEALLTDPPVLSRLAAVGGRLGQAVVEGSDMHFEIQLPPQTDVRRTLDAVRDAYPGTNLVSKQQVSAERATDNHGVQSTLDELTDRQLESLRTAFYAGYFEWPRETSGEEVAELLGIAAPTFSQHLRGAERTVFGALFEDEP